MRIVILWNFVKKLIKWKFYKFLESHNKIVLEKKKKIFEDWLFEFHTIWLLPGKKVAESTS
jgi:hypothetical protein